MGKRGNGEGSIYFQASRQRYAAAVTLDDGTRRVFYARTRPAVAKKLRDALTRKEQGLPFISEQLTVGAWLDYWLEEVVKIEREPTTYALYEIMLRKHIKPHLGGGSGWRSSSPSRLSAGYGSSSATAPASRPGDRPWYD